MKLSTSAPIRPDFADQVRAPAGLDVRVRAPDKCRCTGPRARQVPTCRSAPSRYRWADPAPAAGRCAGFTAAPDRQIRQPPASRMNSASALSICLIPRGFDQRTHAAPPASRMNSASALSICLIPRGFDQPTRVKPTANPRHTHPNAASAATQAEPDPDPADPQPSPTPTQPTQAEPNPDPAQRNRQLGSTEPSTKPDRQPSPPEPAQAKPTPHTGLTRHNRATVTMIKNLVVPAGRIVGTIQNTRRDLVLSVSTSGHPIVSR